MLLSLAPAQNLMTCTLQDNIVLLRFEASWQWEAPTPQIRLSYVWLKMKPSSYHHIRLLPMLLPVFQPYILDGTHHERNLRADSCT